MRNGVVTPPGGPEVTPVVYVDLDIVEINSQPFDADLAMWPGLKTVKLADVGPAGHPIYRIEGPLTTLSEWVRDYFSFHYVDAYVTLAEAKLAR